MSAADILPALAGVVLVAGVALFALLPLLRPARAPADGVAVAVATGVDRFQLYRNVLELEFDYQTGKLSAEDYEALSADLLGRAAAQLRESRGLIDGIDDEVEREIAAARQAFAAARRAPPAAVGPHQKGP